MDELEKKRRQLADPESHLSSISPESASELSSDQIEQLKQQQVFEAQLARAFNVPVKPELADTILLNQGTRQRQKRFSLYGMAASIALVVGIGLILPFVGSQSLSAEAMAHVEHEKSYLLLERHLERQQVAKKLEEMGFVLENLPEHVKIATRCGLNGENIMHIIAQVDGQPVTLFITRPGEKIQPEFANDTYVGKALAGKNNTLIVIAEKMGLVEKLIGEITRV